MFVSRRRIALPAEGICGEFFIKVVEKFKLLGVTIDDNLNFAMYVSNTCKNINYNLKSIRLEAFEMFTWRKMENISWKDHITNEYVLGQVNEKIKV